MVVTCHKKRKSLFLAKTNFFWHNELHGGPLANLLCSFSLNEVKLSPREAKQTSSVPRSQRSMTILARPKRTRSSKKRLRRTSKSLMFRWYSRNRISHSQASSPCVLPFPRTPPRRTIHPLLTVKPIPRLG